MNGPPPPEPGCALRRRRAAALPADERRAMIIDATLPLLVRLGDSVTTHDIAEAAGIAEGTIFRVFANKDELIDAAIERVLDPAPLEEALEAIGTDTALVAALETAVGLIQHRMTGAWQVMSSVGHRFPGRHKRPDLHSAALTQIIEAHPEEIHKPAADAAHILRSITFAMTHPMMTREPAPPAEIVDVFLHGVAALPGSRRPC